MSVRIDKGISVAEALVDASRGAYLLVMGGRGAHHAIGPGSGPGHARGPAPRALPGGTGAAYERAGPLAQQPLL